MKRYLKIALTLFITLIIVLGFAMPLNPAGNWYQQFLPNIGGRQIVDITFTDSLNGCAITNRLSATDSTFILQTTNGGDNWFKVYNDSGVIYTKLQFINQNTGFIGGYIYKGGSFKLLKTTNGGMNWSYINAPFDVPVSDLYALDENNIWLASSSNPTGGVFRTTNGGANWDWQLNIGSLNPTNIYFYNGTTGYISNNTGAPYVRRTTNSGVNWTVNVTGEGFTDMHFADALTGYRSYGTMKKTTDGGLSWVSQVLPTGGMIITSQILRFTKFSKDTILGVGGHVFYPGGTGNRGMIYRTINGGNTWLFQIPDTSINIGVYNFINFYHKSNGWAYSGGPGVHTTNGGDPVWLTPIEQINTEIPKEYHLYQNYPNPFNPATNIKYHITKSNSNVKLVIFDITGKEIINLVNREQDAGIYHVDFSGTGCSSGVYFYSLIIGGAVAGVKKMILLK